MSTSNINTPNLNVNGQCTGLGNRFSNLRNHHAKCAEIHNRTNDEQRRVERQETATLHQQIVNSTTGSKSKAKNAAGGQTARGVKRNYNQANSINHNATGNPANHQSINGSCNGTMLNGNTNGNLNSNSLNGGGPLQASNGNLKAMGKLDDHLNPTNQVQINGKAPNHLPANSMAARNKNGGLMNANEIKKELHEPFISIKNLKDEDLNLKELTETCKDESYDNHLLDDLSDGFNDEFVTKFLEDIGTMTPTNDTNHPHSNNGYGGQLPPQQQQQQPPPPPQNLCNGSSPINNQNANAAYYGNGMSSMNVNKNSSLSNVHSMQQQPNNNQHQLPPPPPMQQQQPNYTNGQVSPMNGQVGPMNGQVGPMNGQMKLAANNKAGQMKQIGSNQQILMVNVPNQSQMGHQMMANQQQPNLSNQPPMIHNQSTAHHLHHPQQTVSPIASSMNPNQLNQSLNSNLSQPPMNQMPPQPSNHHIQPGGVPGGVPNGPPQQQVQMQNQQQFNPNSNLSYQQNVQRINYQTTQSQQANMPNNGGQYSQSPIGQQPPPQHHPHMQSHGPVQGRMMQQNAPMNGGQMAMNSGPMNGGQMNGGQMNGGQMNGGPIAGQMANQMTGQMNGAQMNGQMANQMNGNQIAASQMNAQPPGQPQYNNPNLQYQQGVQQNVQYMQQQPQQHSYANQPPQQNMQFSQQQQPHSHHNMNHSMPTNSMPPNNLPNNLPNNNRILISNQPMQQSQPQYAGQAMNGPPPAKRSTTPMNNNGMMIQSNGPAQSNQMYSNYMS